MPQPLTGASPRRHRPRSALRHYAGLLGPAGATAGRVATERDAQRRLRRLGAAIRDRAREQRRPTRPRMRALSAAPGGRLRWRTVPVTPGPDPPGAMVHPIAIATCDMDPLIAMGAAPFPLPLHLGHECVAEVLSVGAEVTTIRPGQRVIVPFQISCGACRACRSGRTGNCTGVPPVSMFGFGLAGGHWGGAYSDQLAVPYADAMLVPLPEGIDPIAAASVADNVLDGYRHAAPQLATLLEHDPEAEMLIVGAISPTSRFSGSVPLYAGLAARALGGRGVFLAESRPHLREHAERLGIQAFPPKELRDQPRRPLVADVSASPSGLQVALTSTAPDGVCTSSGMLHRTARIPTLELYSRNVTLSISRVHARALIPPVLELIGEGKLRPQEVTTTVAPLDDAPDVLREHYLGGGTKTILTA